MLQDRQTVVSDMITEIKKMADDFNSKRGIGNLEWIPSIERPPQY